MGFTDTEDGGGNESGSVRNFRRASLADRWRSLMCCLRPVDDEVQKLDFRHCSLNDVPAEIFNHERTLEVLYLDCNQITDLPRPLFHCHGLKELSLSDNEIVRLPHALASLIHLQVRLPLSAARCSIVWIKIFDSLCVRYWTCRRTP